MKKLLLVLGLLLLASPVWAEGECEVPEAPCINCADTDSYPGRDKFGYGVVGDIVLVDTDMWWLDEAGVEGRYDVNSEEYGVFAKFKVNVAKLLKGE